MFRGKNKSLKIVFLTLSAVITVASTNKEPRGDVRVVSEAGRIEEPFLGEKETAGIFTSIFKKHTVTHFWNPLCVIIMAYIAINSIRVFDF